VLRQLETGLAELSADAIASMAIAYEPVWAIGTGKTATPDDAAAVHAAIRALLEAKLAARAADVPILYGGSVNTGNAKALLSTPGIDGLLVGGASLDVAGWITICDT